MPELPVINSPSPTIIPATQEKQYNESYIVGLNLYTGQNPTDQSLVVTLMNYNYDTKELDPSMQTHQFKVDSVWAEAARSSLFATVMGGIIQVVALEIQEKTLLSKIEEIMQAYPEPSPEIQTQLDTLNSQLTQVQTALQLK